MKAISYDQFGDLGVLHASEAPAPIAGKGEIVVAVRATSVNVIDSRVRSGMMGPLVSKSFPKIPGADFAGIVSAVGENVSGLKIGDAVFGAVNPFQGGAFAEYVRVPASQVALKPPGISFEDAAALPIAGLAALQALRDAAHLKAGQRVLIHGASGGVGLFALQIAKQMGAVVVAVAGAKSIAEVRKAGADMVIAHETRNVTAEDGPFDVILNASGKMAWADGHALLTPHGVLVEPSPTIPVFVGSALANITRGQRHAMLAVKPNTEDLAQLARMVRDGALHPVIAGAYRFANAVQAIADQEAGGTVGKRVITVA